MKPPPSFISTIGILNSLSKGVQPPTFAQGANDRFGEIPPTSHNQVPIPEPPNPQTRLSPNSNLNPNPSRYSEKGSTLCVLTALFLSPHTIVGRSIRSLLSLPRGNQSATDQSAVSPRPSALSCHLELPPVLTFPPPTSPSRQLSRPSEAAPQSSAPPREEGVLLPLELVRQGVGGAERQLCLWRGEGVAGMGGVWEG